MKFGLLGRKLGHSYSPMIFDLMGGYRYDLFEREPDGIEDLLKNGDFDGLNVTIPYKKEVLQYLDEIDPLALRLGAVNTIVKKNGKLFGYNSDYYGFLSLVQRTRIEPPNKKVLVLGSAAHPSPSGRCWRIWVPRWSSFPGPAKITIPTWTATGMPP